MKKRMLSILTALALCLTLLPAAAGAAGEESNWTYDPGAYTLTNEANESVVIYNVTVMPWDTTGTQLTIGSNGPGSEGYGSGPFFTGAVLDLTGEIKDASGKSYTIADINSSAFMRCTNLAEVNLPASLSIIKLETFSDCTVLTSITLPASVKDIEDNAFRGCTSLTEITVAKDNSAYCTVDGVLFSKNGTQLIQYPAGKTITQYTVPDGVTHIGNSAFSDCTALTSVTLPASVKIIGIGAFSSCLALQTIDLSRCANLTGLSLSAFSNCTALTSITLPASVEVIDNYAFNNCTALTTLTLLSETPPTLGTYVLDGCDSLSQILVPPESVEDYKKAASWSAYADKIFPQHDGNLRLTFSDSNPTMTAGSVPPTITVTLANTGTATLTNLAASLTGNGASAFTLGNLAQTTLEVGASTTFTVTPHANLTAGTYPVTVKLMGNLPAPVTASFTLTVTDPYVPPVIPVDNSEPSYSVSLPGKVTGGTVTAKKSYAEEGETFRFTVTPEAGYELASLAVTDSAGRELKLTNEGGGAYSFTMPAGRVSFDVTFRPVRTALPFADVDESYWAHDEIAWAYKNGYMSGTSAAAFNPGGAVTRQQLAALLYRYAQSQGQGFTGAWAFPLDYPDADQVADYAYEALCWMTMHGVLGGMADGTLNPQGTASRAQLAVMLYRWLT